MGIRGQSGWQSQRGKRHGAPSSNAGKTQVRDALIGSDIRAAYNGCSRLPDSGGLSFRTSVPGRTTPPPMSNTIMTMIRRVVVSILFSHYRTVSLQRSVHSQPANSKRDKRGYVRLSLDSSSQEFL
jgi:hypothetical protein